jgi:hypothetical protein
MMMMMMVVLVALVALVVAWRAAWPRIVPTVIPPRLVTAADDGRTNHIRTDAESRHDTIQRVNCVRIPTCFAIARAASQE